VEPEHAKPHALNRNLHPSEYYWVEEEVCGCADPKLQAVMIDKFILAAAHCKVLNNFNSVFTIIAALGVCFRHAHLRCTLFFSHTPIHSLLHLPTSSFTHSRTTTDNPKVKKLGSAWNCVSKESKKTLKKLLELTSTARNMKTYRTVFRKVPPKITKYGCVCECVRVRESVCVYMFVAPPFPFLPLMYVPPSSPSLSADSRSSRLSPKTSGSWQTATPWRSRASSTLTG
jgi:hypothetical protein